MNASKKDKDSFYKRGAGGGDARRGGWIRSLRRTVGLTEVPAVVLSTRREYMAQLTDELDRIDDVVAEASHALIEADTEHCAAYTLRAARLLERRGSLIAAFSALTAKVERPGRHLSGERVSLVFELPSDLWWSRLLQQVDTLREVSLVVERGTERSSLVVESSKKSGRRSSRDGVEDRETNESKCR